MHAVFHSVMFKQRNGIFGMLNAVRQFISIAEQDVSPRWDIVSAVCLERKPVISRNPNCIEREHMKLMEKFEIEKSFYSDHEMHHLKDLERTEKLIEGTELDESLSSTQQTAQDFEDQCNKELNAFLPGARVTEADKCSDHASISRILDHAVYFILRQKLGKDFQWVFPQAVNVTGESLRQTAERALKESSSNRIAARFMGNAPIGFYKYKYPKTVRDEGVLGAKVFFFKAYLLREDIAGDKIEDKTNLLWLSQKELINVLPNFYYKVVASFILPDDIGTVN